MKKLTKEETMAMLSLLGKEIVGQLSMDIDMKFI